MAEKPRRMSPRMIPKVTAAILDEGQELGGEEWDEAILPGQVQNNCFILSLSELDLLTSSRAIGRRREATCTSLPFRLLSCILPHQLKPSLYNFGYTNNHHMGSADLNQTVNLSNHESRAKDASSAKQPKLWSLMKDSH